MMTEIIPETHTLGSINPHTLFVDLNAASRDDIVTAQSGGGSSRPWEIYEHEARHWRDLLATVWGRQYLDLLFRTYDALLTTPEGQIDTTYAQVLELFDTDRAILFPSYYKYVLPGAHRAAAGERWSMGFSTGVKVAPDGSLNSAQPFIFVRFDAGRTHIARQPVSEGSLLETRALAAEIAALNAWGQMCPAGEGIVAMRLKQKELKDLSYDAAFTTYSVAAHVVTYAAGARDIQDALALGDKLADICFNLTNGSFAKLTPTRDLGDPGSARLRGFRKSRNRGYAFCCLAFALRPHLRGGAIGRTEIELAMKTAGLPSLQQVYRDARKAIDMVPGRAAADPILSEIRLKLLEAGRQLHSEPDFDAAVASLQFDGEAFAPLVADRKCDIFSLGHSPITQAESEFLYECHERYRRVLRLALRAARGLDFEFSDYVY